MSDETTEPRPPDQTARVVELEERIMFLQQSLEDLNGVVLEQQAKLSRLHRELESLRGVTQRLIERGEGTNLPDEKPPHY